MRHATRIDLGILGLILIFLLITANISNRAGRLVFKLGRLEVPIVTFCPMKNLLGIDCPTCGVTRSLVAWVHGDVPAAMHYHRLSILIIIGVISQLFYRIYTLLSGRRLSFFANPLVFQYLAYGILILWGLNWGFNLLLKFKLL